MGDWANYADSPLRAFENELGVQAPVGYWDPLGLGKDGDADVFRRRREVEIKHGRLCMIATIGFMVTSVGYRFPGELSPSTGITFEKVPAGLDAIGAVPALGWVQIFVFCGLMTPVCSEQTQLETQVTLKTVVSWESQMQVG